MSDVLISAEQYSEYLELKEAQEPREVTFKVAGMQERGKLHIEPEIAKEPVAWMYPRRYGSGLSFAKPTNVICNEDGMRVDPTPLYAAPPDTRAKALEEADKRDAEHLQACKAACVRLAKEKLALEDDAARYRYIRNGNQRFDGQRSNEDYLYGEELDAAIDAAITGKP